MKQLRQPHPLQRQILRQLLFSDGLRYSQLKPKDEYLENSQFMFHLNKLIEDGVVEKKENRYVLTLYGKEYANKISDKTGEIEFQAKVTTVLVGKNDKGELLVYKRLKQPFYGFFGFPTEKVRHGEKIQEAAIRGFTEETGLVGTIQLFAIRHYKVYDPSGDLLEDKLMHGFLFTDPTGVFESNKEGDYFWANLEMLQSLSMKPLLEFWDFYQAQKTFDGTITFAEVDVQTDEF